MLLLEKNDFKMNRDTVNSRMEMKIKSQYVSFINSIKDLKPFFRTVNSLLGFFGNNFYFLIFLPHG